MVDFIESLLAEKVQEYNSKITRINSKYMEPVNRSTFASAFASGATSASLMHKKLEYGKRKKKRGGGGSNFRSDKYSLFILEMLEEEDADMGFGLFD